MKTFIFEGCGPMPLRRHVLHGKDLTDNIYAGGDGCPGIDGHLRREPDVGSEMALPQEPAGYRGLSFATLSGIVERGPQR